MISAASEPQIPRTRPRRSGNARTLQRYVLLEIVRCFALCLLALGVVLFAIVSVKLIHKGLNVIQLRGAALALSVSLLPYLLPFAFMTGLVMAFGRLSSDNELLAVRAAGIHLGRLLGPVLLVGLLLSGAGFYLNGTVAPDVQRKLASLDVDVFRGFLKRMQALPTRVIAFPAYNVHIGGVEGDLCRDVVLFHARGGNLLEILRADEMRIEMDAARGGIVLHLRNCNLVVPDAHPPTYVREAAFESLSRFVDMGFTAPRARLNPPAFRWEELLSKAGEIAGSLGSYPALLPNPKKALKAAERQMEAALAECNARAEELNRETESREVEESRLRQVEQRIKTLEAEVGVGEAGSKAAAELARFRAMAEEARKALAPKGEEIERLRMSRDKFEKEWRFRDAQAQLARLQCSSADVAAEIHQRLALSIAPLALGLVGVPLGMRVTRKGFLTAVGTSFAFALLVYYPLSLLGDILGGQVKCASNVFIWLPNAVAFVAGVVLLVRASRR